MKMMEKKSNEMKEVTDERMKMMEKKLSDMKVVTDEKKTVEKKLVAFVSKSDFLHSKLDEVIRLWFR